MTSLTEPLPYLTTELPGIGGRLKELPEDFVVEEIPAYEPSGEGQHLFLWIEKKDLPHDLLLRRISKILEISQDDIGTAGIKDRRAVTRQFVSVPNSAASRVEQLESDELHVLKAVPHGNKLRTGHLRGNRFTIVVKGAHPDSENRARLIAQVGLDLLSGQKSPRDIPFSKRKFLLRLALSAVQSELFNHCLALRLRDGLLNTVLDGDVLEVVESGGKFVGEDAVSEQARLDQGELAVTGPRVGVKMLSPRGVPAEREALVLEHSGLKQADFEKFPQLLSGARRAYVNRPGELVTTAVEGGIRFQFAVPSGVYATMLLREFMKDENPA